MENPVVISKEDWSLGNHQLGFVYDVQDGTTDGAMAFIDTLKNGANMESNERFTQFIETFDLLCEYNINGADPLGALYEQDPIYVVDGEAAFWANGCWAWPNLSEAGASIDDAYGFVPFVFGNDTADFANTGIEAAGIDGATGIQKMKEIILPLMVPSFVICLFLTLSRAFMVYDVNLTLTGGEPYGTTRLVAMYVHDKAFNSRQYGVGQAEALVLFVVVACISALHIYVGKKKEIEA